MHPCHSLRAAPLALAFAASVLSVTTAALAGETYNYETDVWPLVHSRMQTETRYQQARSQTSYASDASTAPSAGQAHPSIYDPDDESLDPKTGTHVPGSPANNGG